MYEALSNSTMVLSLDDGAFPPCGFTLGHNKKCPGMQCVAHGAARAITRTRTYVRHLAVTHGPAGARVKVRSTPAHCRFGGVAVAKARLCVDSEGVWSHQPWRGTWRSAPTWRCAPHTSSTACTASDVSSRPRRKWPLSPSSSSWPAPP